MKKSDADDVSKLKKFYLLKYAKLVKKLKRHLTRSQMIQNDISRDVIRHHFGTVDLLKSKSKETYPEFFKNILDEKYFSTEVFDQLVKETKKYKKFIVTTAVGGAPVHKGFYSSIKIYCKINNAKLLILPANYALREMDKKLVQSESIVFRGLPLNSNISISAVKIDPKQVDPTTGLDLVGSRDGTILLGSPKQRRRPIANSANKLAHILQATGAITRPRYVPADGEPKRRDFLAEKQHVIGAIVVEIVDDELFHFRNVEMSPDGSFNDIGTNYSKNGTKKSITSAIVEGDRHNLATDPQVDKVIDKVCEIAKPKYRVFHDTFDGISVNPHEVDNKVLRAIDAGSNRLNLRNEIEALGSLIKNKTDLNTSKYLVIVKSNHDEFLERYIARGYFDDYNRITATQLMLYAMEGKDPLQAGVKEYTKNIDFSKVIWLQRDDDFRISKKNIEVGCHGDIGANGKRSPGGIGMLKAYGKCVYGHCHYGEIYHDAMSVGTTSFMKQRYNKGASSWTHTFCWLYEDGTRQLINSINGQYKFN